MTTQVAHWEHFRHPAGVGVRGVGESLDQAFEQAGLALTAVVADPAKVRPAQPVVIECEASRASLLLLDWLEALIREMNTRRMRFSRFELHLGPPDLGGGLGLYALAWGEAQDSDPHPPPADLKGPTYEELEVTQDEHDRWIAQCVVEV
ncbi:MAG: archease [Meiothermus sp.]|nr:archease [Meiothermus sp.]